MADLNETQDYAAIIRRFEDDEFTARQLDENMNSPRNNFREISPRNNMLNQNYESNRPIISSRRVSRAFRNDVTFDKTI